MPIVELKLWKGRTQEQVKYLIERITQAVCEGAECKKEHVQVIITEVEKDHWGIGGIPGDELKNEKKD